MGTHSRAYAVFPWTALQAGIWMVESRCAAAAVCEERALQRLTVWYHTTLPRGTVALEVSEPDSELPTCAGAGW